MSIWSKRTRRVAWAVVLAGVPASALLAASAAPAANSQATWHKIAQRARFPVYRPTKTLGLKLSGLVLDRDGCLLAGWGKPPFSSKGRHFGLYEHLVR